MASVQLRNVKKIYPMEPEIAGRKKRREIRETVVNEGAPNLQITEEGVVAVQDFTLDIADKEFIVLVGPSGCGKSTTLRMVAGLEDITEGDLYIDGVRVNDVASKDRDIAMVFQNYALFPYMTVYENMAFPLKLRKEPKSVIDEKVREAAEILDITEYLDRKPKSLSGGQRQRVAIGRAIVRNPSVFLMDEPLSNLDAKLRNQMRTEIIKLRKRIDTTFIYVTHDQVEAMTLGDRIVIMKDGYIQQIGTPQQVYNNPANLFVAQFIGAPQMNLFNAELMERHGSYYVEFCGERTRLSPDREERLEKNHVKGSFVTMGLRPEDLRLSREGVPAEVEVSELMGTSVYLHVLVNAEPAVIVVPVLDNGSESYKTGQIVHFTFSGSAVRVFSRQTGRNLEIPEEQPKEEKQPKEEIPPLDENPSEPTPEDGSGDTF